MPTHRIPTRYCHCRACKQFRESRRTGPTKGIADLPGFRESLRILLVDEEYALEDVAQMFGVSRERIRQLTDREGIQRPIGSKGMLAVRVWDDTRHCFRPIGKGVVKRARADGARAIRRHVREQYRLHTLAALDALSVAKKWNPCTISEVWKAVSGQVVAGESAWCRVNFAARVPRTYAAFTALVTTHGIVLHGQGERTAEGEKSRLDKMRGPREALIERNLNVLMAYHVGLKPRDTAATLGISANLVSRIVSTERA